MQLAIAVKVFAVDQLLATAAELSESIVVKLRLKQSIKRGLDLQLLQVTVISLLGSAVI